MRELNRKQKAILEEWFVSNSNDVKIPFHATSLPDEVYWKVYNVNDFETINAAIERFIEDLVSENINKRERYLAALWTTRLP